MGLLLTVAPVWAQDSVPWAEKAATVRAYVYVPRAAGAARAEVLWRLPLEFPSCGAAQAAPHVAVYRASDGKRMGDVYVREFSADRVAVAFEAPSAGNYVIYGAPYAGIGERVFSRTVWMEKYKPENYPDFSRFPVAETVAVELRDIPADDPYAACATRTEADAYFSRAKEPFQAYFVPAKYPLNGQDRLPLLWIGTEGGDQASGGFFSRVFGKKQAASVSGDTVRVSAAGKALVQVGVVCTGTSPLELSVRHTSAPGAGILLHTAGGESLRIAPRQVRSVWITVDASSETPEGTYDLTVRLEGGGTARDVPFVLQVSRVQDGPAALRRADFVSRIGVSVPADRKENYEVNSRFPVAVYEGYQVRSGQNVLAINPQTALPLQIYSGDTPLLADPVLLVFSTPNGIRKIGVKDLRFVRREGGVQVWRGSVRTHDMEVGLQASLSAYGLVHYDMDVQALSEIDFRNISLEAGFSDRVVQACYDSLCVDTGTVLSWHPAKGFSGLWLGGESGGVFVTVDPDSSNTFYSGENASVTLYKGARSGLIVGSGAFRMGPGEHISLRCSMQILPADYAPEQAAGRNILWVRGDSLPMYSQAALADRLVVEDPLLLVEPENDRRAGELSARGIKILPYIRPFALPAAGFPARVLSSMGYASHREDKGRTLRFDPDVRIAPAVESLYREILGKEYVSGVLLSDTPYNRSRLPGYSLLRTAQGHPLSVMWYEKGFDASLLGFAPWIDAVITADTLGTAGGACQVSLGGLTEYFGPAPGQDVLGALAHGRNAYGVFPDTASLRWSESLWTARKILGLEGDSVYFYPERTPGLPVSVSNPFVRVSAYKLSDRLVVVCRNTAPTGQRFVPEFDFDALGIKRWEVDRLELAAVGSLQQGRMLLMGDEIPAEAGATVVVVLRWARRTDG